MSVKRMFANQKDYKKVGLGSPKEDGENDDCSVAEFQIKYCRKHVFFFLSSFWVIMSG